MPRSPVCSHTCPSSWVFSVLAVSSGSLTYSIITVGPKCRSLPLRRMEPLRRFPPLRSYSKYPGTEVRYFLPSPYVPASDSWPLHTCSAVPLSDHHVGAVILQELVKPLLQFDGRESPPLNTPLQTGQVDFIQRWQTEQRLVQSRHAGYKVRLMFFRSLA